MFCDIDILSRLYLVYCIMCLFANREEKLVSTKTKQPSKCDHSYLASIIFVIDNIFSKSDIICHYFSLLILLYYSSDLR